MKKILATLSIIFCLAFAMMGMGGCSSCSPSDLDGTGNGGQTEVDKITTLEGTWKSEEGRAGEYSIIYISDSSIKIYNNTGVIDGGRTYLDWAGIYIPISDSVSGCEWTFENDPTCDEKREDNNSRLFKYLNKQLSCYMKDPHGNPQTISFTRVTD